MRPDPLMNAIFDLTVLARTQGLDLVAEKLFEAMDQLDEDLAQRQRPSFAVIVGGKCRA